MNIENAVMGAQVANDRALNILLKRALRDQKINKLGQSAVILSLLSACGGSGGSGGNTSSGTVIDGYISAARVFRDTNNDFELSGSEVSTLTNTLGVFPA